MVGDSAEGPQPTQGETEKPGVEIGYAQVWPTQEAEDEINPEPPFDTEYSWELIHDHIGEGSAMYESHRKRWDQIRENRAEFEKSVRDVKIYTSPSYRTAKDWGVVLIGPDGKKWADKTFPELVEYLGFTARKLLEVFPVYPDAPATVSVLEAIYDGMGERGVQKLANILGKHTEFRYRSEFRSESQKSHHRFSADPEEKPKKRPR